MRLTTVTMMASEAAAPPASKGFRALTHHVTELFTHFLPKGYTLDGSGRVTVTCGPRGSEPQYMRALGTSNFFAENFDFKRFYGSSGEARDQMTLETLKDSLSSIARMHGDSPAVVEPIVEAARKVSDSGFQLMLPVKKLSMTCRERKFRIQVSRCLNRDSGEAWLAELFDPAGSKRDEKWVTGRTGSLDMREHFREAQFESGTYKIFDRFDKVIFEWRTPEG